MPRFLRFTRFVLYYKSLSGSNFGLKFKNQDGCHSRFFQNNQMFCVKLWLVLRCRRLNLFMVLKGSHLR